MARVPESGYLAVASGQPCKGVFFGWEVPLPYQANIEWVNLRTRSLDAAVTFVIDYCRDNNVPCGLHTPGIRTSSRQRFYGIARGRATGVVLSYEDCLTVTRDSPGRRFKGFPTAEEAVDWVLAHGGPFSLPEQGLVVAIAHPPRPRGEPPHPGTPPRERRSRREHSSSSSSSPSIYIENLYITVPPSKGTDNSQSS